MQGWQLIQHSMGNNRQSSPLSEFLYQLPQAEQSPLTLPVPADSGRAVPSQGLCASSHRQGSPISETPVPGDAGRTVPSEKSCAS